MSYLDQVLAGAKSSQQRQQGNAGGLNNLLTTLTLRKQAEAARAMQARAVSGSPVAAPQTSGMVKASKPIEGLDGDFNSRLSQLIRDSGGKIKVGSGYRSIAEQTKIYNDWKAGKHPAPRVAKPGSSNHNHGLAADLQFLSPEAKAYAHANAAKYGLRFPMGDEPWHIEPLDARAKRKAKGY